LRISIILHKSTTLCYTVYLHDALPIYEIIGFKLGYAIDANVFYSWIGGVKENYRNNGVANELMNQQHNWCRQNGFQIIRTKTMRSEEHTSELQSRVDLV